MDIGNFVLIPYLFGLMLLKTIDWMQSAEGYGEIDMRCEPLTVRACIDAVPYNETTLPNMFGHEKQKEIENAIREFDPLIKVNCSPYLRQFLGFIYCPPCTLLNYPIPPCREYCEKAAEGCVEILRNFGFEPLVLDCKKYPSASAKLCIRTNATYSNISLDSNTSNHVFPHNENWYTGTGGSFEIEAGSENDMHASTPVDLFLISSSEYSIQLLNIEAVKSMEEVSIFSGPMARLCSSVDFYPPKRYVFWASNMEGKIFRGKLVSDRLTDFRDIVDTGSSTVLSLAVDWLLGILFWTETLPAKLRTSSLSGRRVTTILADDMVNPICLTLDPEKGLVFWIDVRGGLFDSWGSLESYSLVTEERKFLLNITSSVLENAGRPKSLTADIAEKRLYWVDARSESLHSIRYDGSDHKILLRQNEYLHEPDSVVIYKSHVIWTDRETSSLAWVNKKTGSDFLVIQKFEYNPPLNIRIFQQKSDVAGSMTYDKSSLTKQWQEISSRENMEPIEDDDYEDYYDDYDDDDDDDKKSSRDEQKSTNKKNRSSLCFIPSGFIHVLLLCSLCLLCV